MKPVEYIMRDFGYNRKNSIKIWKMFKDNNVGHELCNAKDINEIEYKEVIKNLPLCSVFYYFGEPPSLKTIP